HGYNPPPVWTLVGHALASLHAADASFFRILAALDLVLLAAMCLAIYWAFGWRVLCGALVFWGCQYPASYGWTGGAFLRQDWIFWLVVTACLLKKGWHGAAGATFAYSTLLRIFPGVLLIGPVALAGWHFWRHRYLAGSHWRMAAGGLLAAAGLVITSLLILGEGDYKDFWRHIILHNSTPLPNHMGLKTIFSHSFYAPRAPIAGLPEAPWSSWPVTGVSEGQPQQPRDEGFIDPFLAWKESRRERFKALMSIYLVAV